MNVSNLPPQATPCKGTVADCTKCGQNTYVMPLHDDRGGPLMCFMCAGAWHAEHGPRRRARRVLIKAMKAYEAAGGRLFDKDFDELKCAAGGFTFREDDDVGNDFNDLTSELLAATIALTHPDKHPIERKAEANRVTQELQALKPFVFPAPEPEPPPKPEAEARRNSISEIFGKQQRYPCRDCVDEVPYYYCDACRAEYDQREQERTAKQRADYRQHRKRLLHERPLRQCEECGLEFKRSRTDARYCCETCRQRAHRKAKALVTGKHRSKRVTPTSRDKVCWEGGILAALERYPAVFLNDLLPQNRTRAQYQALCLAAVNLEAAGKIDSFSYWARYGKPGFKALARLGHKIDNPDQIPRLKAKERARFAKFKPLPNSKTNDDRRAA